MVANHTSSKELSTTKSLFQSYAACNRARMARNRQPRTKYVPIRSASHNCLRTSVQKLRTKHMKLARELCTKHVEQNGKHEQRTAPLAIDHHLKDSIRNVLACMPILDIQELGCMDSFAACAIDPWTRVTLDPWTRGSLGTWSPLTKDELTC